MQPVRGGKSCWYYTGKKGLNSPPDALRGGNAEGMASVKLMQSLQLIMDGHQLILDVGGVFNA